MKCTTYEQLHLEMARVYDTCKDTIFRKQEYLCLRFRGHQTCDFPCFTGTNPTDWEFFLGIVEDKLVWEGDDILFCGKPVKAHHGSIFSPDCAFQWSWNPPAPRKPTPTVEELEALIAKLQKELLEIWDKKPKTVSISVNGGEAITIDQMVDRFLSWKLPVAFHPDAGISFKPDFNVGTPYPGTPYPMKHEPIGANLFDAGQARAMILYLLEGKCNVQR